MGKRTQEQRGVDGGAPVSRRAFLEAGGAFVLAAGAVPPAFHIGAAPKAPNILLFFPDQQRYDWTGLNRELPLRTPHFNRLAERGVAFERAYCPSPVCAPSRACLALGMAYGRAGVRDNSENLADGAVTMYQRLRERGYRVGSVGKLDLRKAGHDWGVDGMHRIGDRVYFREWGFTDGLDSEGKGDSFNGIRIEGDPPRPVGRSPYTRMLEERSDNALETYIAWRDARSQSALPHSGFSYTTPIALADEAYNDNWVGQNGLDIVRDFPTGQPWFLQVNFPGPHNPMDVTPAMAAWYAEADFPQPHANDQLAPEVHIAIRRNYAAMIDNIDRWLGRYVDLITAREELDTTLIVYSSDHGEMLGDHNRWAKRVPYEPSAAVPLAIAGPGVRAGIGEHGPAATLDLTATFLDYAGISVPDAMDSRSLRPLLEGGHPTREHVTSGLGWWRMVTDGRYKLVAGFEPETPEPREVLAPPADAILRLADLAADPSESRDVAAANPEIVARLRPHLPTA
jgi:arylsulfatase